jgi:hypothetical protein
MQAGREGERAFQCLDSLARPWWGWKHYARVVPPWRRGRLALQILRGTSRPHSSSRLVLDRMPRRPQQAGPDGVGARWRSRGSRGRWHQVVQLPSTGRQGPVPSPSPSPSLLPKPPLLRTPMVDLVAAAAVAAAAAAGVVVVAVVVAAAVRGLGARARESFRGGALGHSRSPRSLAGTVLEGRNSLWFYAVAGP